MKDSINGLFCLLSVYFHLVLWCSLLVTIRGALACLTIGFQLVVFVYPALLEMNLWFVFILDLDLNLNIWLNVLLLKEILRIFNGKCFVLILVRNVHSLSQRFHGLTQLFKIRSMNWRPMGEKKKGKKRRKKATPSLTAHCFTSI